MIRGAMTCAWVLLGLAIGGAGVARAADFEFSYFANGVSVMGIFNTSPDGPDQYLITGITNGTRGGIPITLLAPNSPLVYTRNDNVLYFPAAGDEHLDSNGFGFMTTTDNYDTYLAGPKTFDEEDYTSNGSQITAADFKVTPVPAPIPGGGLLSFLAAGVASLLWRRRAIVGVGRGLRAGRRRGQCRWLIAVAALSVGALLAAGVAKADTFGFSYAGDGISAMGTFTATLTSPGQYKITGITGERNGVSIASLINFYGNDNVLIYPANPTYLDTNGVSYSTVGGAEYNVYYSGSGYDEYTSAGGSDHLSSFTVPAPIPGGGLLSFLAAGVAGLLYLGGPVAGFGRRIRARLEA